MHERSNESTMTACGLSRLHFSWMRLVLYTSLTPQTKRGRLGGASGEKKWRDWPADAQQRVLIAGLAGECKVCSRHNIPRRSGSV